MSRTGISYRLPMTVWIDSRPSNIDFLEIPADAFIRPELQNRLAVLAKGWPLAIRSTSLSLGTPGPLREDLLQPVVDLATAISPLWVSEIIGFSRTADTDLNFLCPIAPSDEAAALLGDHATEISDRCGCPVLLETIASPLQLGPPLSEPEFLNRLCELSGCNLLLDGTSLFVNSRNHGFDAGEWLSRLDPKHIAQLHIAGYRNKDGHWEDLHDSAIQHEIWDLVRLIHDRCPDVGGILEHDVDIPPVETLEWELDTLKKMDMSR